MRSGRGWISTNDGPGFATQLARFLALDRNKETREDRRARWRAVMCPEAGGL